MTLGRRELIRKIISEQHIEKQSQLLEALEAYGIQCTQATLSRDIKAMNIIKQSGPVGHYRYALSTPSDENVRQKLKVILRESVQSVDAAQNIVVVKTLSGLANAAGAAIDAMNIAGLVGTLAGDNTVFLAMQDAGSATQLRAEFERLLCEK